MSLNSRPTAFPPLFCSSKVAIPSSLRHSRFPVALGVDPLLELTPGLSKEGNIQRSHLADIVLHTHITVGNTHTHTHVQMQEHSCTHKRVQIHSRYRLGQWTEGASQGEGEDWREL